MTISSAITHYVFEGYQVLAEHNGSTGAVLTDHVYSGSSMITKVASGNTQYFLRERLSTRLVLDSSGNLSGRMATLHFGEQFGERGSVDEHHLSTYQCDDESATDYAINRQYSFGLGRFLQTDPLSGCIRWPQEAKSVRLRPQRPRKRTRSTRP
jgi:hypothetical protein